METPHRYSVSPLPSYCTVTPVRRSLSFAESLGQVVRWMTGKQRPALPTERMIERRIVEEIRPTGGRSGGENPRPPEGPAGSSGRGDRAADEHETEHREPAIGSNAVAGRDHPPRGSRRGLAGRRRLSEAEIEELLAPGPPLMSTPWLKSINDYRRQTEGICSWARFG
jgi:hypothetical protein